MPGVKQSQTRLLALGAGFLAVWGCASGDLARFAPPGIVKYEDLAGDQPVNPAIAERIAERPKTQGTAQFPRLGETPGKEDRPARLPKKKRAAATEMLVDARDTLAEEVAADRAAAEAELDRDLSAESDDLKARLESDSAAAARERREPLTPPDPEQ